MTTYRAMLISYHISMTSCFHELRFSILFTAKTISSQAFNNKCYVSFYCSDIIANEIYVICVSHGVPFLSKPTLLSCAFPIAYYRPK